MSVPILSLALTLLCAVVLGDQSSYLQNENRWSGGMTADICIQHNLYITCGWEMTITFSTPISVFNIWSAEKVTNTDTQFDLRHLSWSTTQSCHPFEARFSAGQQQPSVTAVFTRICSNGAWFDISGDGGGEVITTLQPQPTPPRGEISENDYSLLISTEWPRGLEAQICLFHTIPITCGFSAEIVFSPPIRALDVWSLTVVDEIRTDTDVTYIVRNKDWNPVQPNNPDCHGFVARHRRNRPPQIKGRYIRACHNNRDDFEPNRDGTAPPPSTSTTTTTAAPTTISSTASTTTPTTASTTASPQTPSPTTAAPSSTTSSTTSAPTPGPTVGPSRFDFTDALEKSMLFYFVQRSGPINDNIVPWRNTDSAMQDGADVGKDLTGGWYDAGDHVKFGFPMAASATNLLWGLNQWKMAYESTGNYETMLQVVKHPLDYFLKCWDNENQILYGQVGDGNIDHSIWGRPEDMTMPRPTFQIDRNNGGSDLAGETAAALAAGYLAFKDTQNSYAQELLTAAEQLYTFADTHRKMYHESITNAASFYKSWNGFYDELCWGAAWLLKATGNESYRTKARAAMSRMNQYPIEFSWDDKAIGCYVVMHQLSSGNEKAEYEAKIVNYMSSWMNFLGGIQQSPCGLAWFSQWGSLRYTANSALIGLMAADQGINPDSYRRWAQLQIEYMLGANFEGFSYQIGYGTNYPLRPHHQSSACPVAPEPCDWSNYQDPNPNPNVLIGALVGGPDQNDYYVDDRDDYVKNEVTTDYNAGFQSSLAGLIQLQMTSGLPNATPKCTKGRRNY